MKKLKYILVCLFFFCFIGTVNAGSLEKISDNVANFLVALNKNDTFILLDDSTLDYDDWHNVFPDIDAEDTVDGCSTALVRQTSDGVEFTTLGQFLQDLFSLIRIAVPALVVILTTIDYIKAIASSNADELKKANGRTIKRLIVGILIFLLPFLLDILFDLFGLYDLSRCNIGG